MIKISTLPLIKSPQEFFEAEKIILIDIIEVERSFQHIYNGHPGLFRMGNNIYFTLILKGSPENLIINAKGGLPYNAGPGYKGIYFWGNDLFESIRLKQIYDWSGHYKKYPKGSNPFITEPEFFYNLFKSQTNQLV